MNFFKKVIFAYKLQGGASWGTLLSKLIGNIVGTAINVAILYGLNALVFPSIELPPVFWGAVFVYIFYVK